MASIECSIQILSPMISSTEYGKDDQQQILVVDAATQYVKATPGGVNNVYISFLEQSTLEHDRQVKIPLE